MTRLSLLELSSAGRDHASTSMEPKSAWHGSISVDRVEEFSEAQDVVLVIWPKESGNPIGGTIKGIVGMSVIDVSTAMISSTNSWRRRQPLDHTHNGRASHDARLSPDPSSAIRCDTTLTGNGTCMTSYRSSQYPTLL